MPPAAPARCVNVYRSAAANVIACKAIMHTVAEDRIGTLTVSLIDATSEMSFSTRKPEKKGVAVMSLTKPGFSRLLVIVLFSAIVGAKIYAGCSTPVVNSVTPNTGSTAGGTAVTISGNNFFNPSTVTFGGAAATNVVVVNSTTITATTPAHAAGTVDVVVADADGCPGL